MLKLAERMVMSFCGGVSASTTHTWTTLSGTGAGDVRVMTRKSVDDPGRPSGIVLSAATSFWLPLPPNRVFHFLRDENSRNEVLYFTSYNEGEIDQFNNVSVQYCRILKFSQFSHTLRKNPILINQKISNILIFRFLKNFIYYSGIFFQMVELFKKWLTLPMAVTQAIVFHYYELT